MSAVEASSDSAHKNEPFVLADSSLGSSDCDKHSFGSVDGNSSNPRRDGVMVSFAY